MIELCGNPLIASHNGFNIIEGSAFEDQIWGTSGKDLILGYEGNDDIKGFEGDDVLCGGEGADGLNGGSGHDQLFGAEGRDLIFGNSGSDTIIGGDGVDGLFGGDGSDAITGGIYVVPVTSPWVPVDDDAADYVIGGPMPDMVDLATGMVPGTDDEIYQETQSNNSCPGWMYVPAAGAQPVPHAKDPAFSIMKLGVFNPNRLYIVDAAHPCLTIRGKVRDAHPAGDGDEHMNVQGEEVTVEILDVVAPGLDISVLEELAGGQKIVLELMPRDKLLFDTPTNGATVVASGLLVKDFCHGTGHVCDEEEDAAECEAEPGEPNEICHLELHPVYSFKVGTGATKFSGPREGGSPYAIKPDWISGPVPMDGPGVTATDGSGTHYRYCWLALGGPCAAWGGSGGAFQ
jgi:hypothetical protein